MKEDSMDDVKMAGMVKKAGDMPTNPDKNSPVYWSEEKWQTEYFNQNPEALWRLETFKDMIIRKYENEQEGNWQEVN